MYASQLSHDNFFLNSSGLAVIACYLVWDGRIVLK